MKPTATHTETFEEIARLTLKLHQEREARIEAEHQLQEKSAELFTTNHVLKKTAEVLEDQRSQLNIILDHAITAIFLANSDLTLCRANKAAKELFGLDDESLMELSVTDLIVGFDKEMAAEHIAKSQTCMSRSCLNEAAGRHKDGAEFPIEFGVARMAHKNRNHTVWIFSDITERKMAALQREALERELGHAQKMEALGTLASGVAHEINTPVQYVSDNVRFLQDAIADMSGLFDLYEQLADSAASHAPSERLLKQIAEKTQAADLAFLLEEAPLSIEQSLHGIAQVASIVNAIKEFSHPNDDDYKEIDLNKAIETTLAVSRNQWKYVAEVELDLDPDLPMITASPGGINQVLLNIIGNATDAIAEFKAASRGIITITTAACGHSVELRIADNGGGISEDVGKKIFDPFYTTKDVGKGTGQGLAICDNIIRKKHGGSIEFETCIGSGTAFIITLPIDSFRGDAS